MNKLETLGDILESDPAVFSNSRQAARYPDSNEKAETLSEMVKSDPTVFSRGENR